MSTYLNGQKAFESIVYARLIAYDGSRSYIEVPRVTTTQRDALQARPGTIVYNTDAAALQVRTAPGWEEVVLGSQSSVVTALPPGTFGDTLIHDGTEWGVENTGPLTTPKRTLVVLGSSLMFPGTNGATIYEEVLAGGRIVRGASFEASASPITAQIGLPMPANWDGDAVTAQFLVATAAVTGTVKFGIAGRASVNSGSLDQAFGTPQTVTLDIGAQTNPAAWDLWTTAPTPAVTVADVGEGRNWVQFEITRDPGDTCAEAVVLLAVVVEYGTDGFSDA